MTARRFAQVDVFTATPFFGNPVAVVLDGADLTTAEMKAFARWTNLSETTFVLPPTDPGADYRVRIFTADLPREGSDGWGELPFAGHPTLGTCHAWLTCGGVPREPDVIVQECGLGLVPIRRAEGRLAFAAPALQREGPVHEATIDRVAAGLGVAREEIVDAAWADNGPGWVAILLASAEAVLALAPGRIELPIGVAGPHPPGSDHALEVRAFVPGPSGVAVEDPVTGSLNAGLAQWLLGSGRATAPYTAAQGRVLARAGVVHVTRDPDGTIWVGGDTVTCIAGTAEI